MSSVDISQVCPNCSNRLIIGRVPTDVALHPDDEHLRGKQRFECRTCPFHYIIEGTWYERRNFPRKEVEDVMGGKDAWANVDKTEGMESEYDRAPPHGRIAEGVEALSHFALTE